LTALPAKVLGLGWGCFVNSLQVDALKRYAQAVRDTVRSGPTNIEQALAPAFKNLLDELLATLVVGAGINTVPEYAQKDIGRPDIALIAPVNSHVRLSS
jgi:hypothetical protein